MYENRALERVFRCKTKEIRGDRENCVMKNFKIGILRQILLNNQIKEIEIVKACSKRGI
jgi:hypothetical protein